MMANELGKMQILLEGIRSDVKAIAEGHSVLLNGIRQVDTKLEEFRSDVELKLNGIALTVKEIKRDLSEHIRQSAPPAHVRI